MDEAVTVAVVAKKLLEILASSEKGRKFLGYVVGIVLIVVLLPIVALVGLFGWMSGGDAPINAQQIVAQLPAEDQAEIQDINLNAAQILTVFTDKGLTETDVKKAQAIYIACLFGKESDTFAADLADCFLNISDSVSVYDNIASKFSVTFEDKDKQYFDERFGITRKNTIDTSGFTDANTKKAHDLVEWAKIAYAQKWGYVYGANGMPDLGADGMYNAATEKGSIDTMPDTPGLAVYIAGQHIGIYVGDGYVIYAANTQDGVIKTKLDGGGWTHWLKIPYIKYE